MNAKMNVILENLKDMSSDEKAFVAHCLISSLEDKHDEDVESAWAELAAKRYAELKSGKVKGIAWEAIKKEIKG